MESRNDHWLETIIDQGAHRPAMLYGAPGTGKTTLMVQAAVDLAQRGYNSLYVALEESVQRIQERMRWVARSGASARRVPELERVKVLGGPSSASRITRCVTDAVGAMSDSKFRLVVIDALPALYERFGFTRAELTTFLRSVIAETPRDAALVFVNGATKSGQPVWGAATLDPFIQVETRLTRSSATRGAFIAASTRTRQTTQLFLRESTRAFEQAP